MVQPAPPLPACLKRLADELKQFRPYNASAATQDALVSDSAGIEAESPARVRHAAVLVVLFYREKGEGSGGHGSQCEGSDAGGSRSEGGQNVASVAGEGGSAEGKEEVGEGGGAAGRGGVVLEEGKGAGAEVGGVGEVADGRGELRVLLTTRAKGLSSHAGEVALPGGKRDPEDADDAATALREAHEEIGLPPESVIVVACLEPFLSKHLLTVTPVLGLLPRGASFSPTLNPSEVDAVFDAPLALFLENDGHTYEDVRWFDIPFRIHYFSHEHGGRQFKIWGLTASILIRAAAVVHKRPPAFDEFHFECPDYRTLLEEFVRRGLIIV